MPSLHSLNLSKNAVIFERALGDNIQMFYRSKTYQLLEHLNGENGKLNVILRGKYNPFIHEIFLNHPKREYFTLGYEELPIEYQGEVGLLNIHDYEEIAQFDTQEKPVFYPLVSDEPILNALPTDKPYIIFSSGAGIDRTFEGEMRSIPLDIAEVLNYYILDECERRGYNLFVTGKSYHQAFGRGEVKAVEGSIDLVDKLSIPGSLKVMQGARAIITAHSAPIVLAWEERKSCISIVPPSLYRNNVVGRDYNCWGYGFAYPECTGLSYLNIKRQDIVNFFDRL
jgi:ADP-heptose:LPS heptosyltransferase